MAGTFGYELDPNKLSDEEKQQMRDQVADYKKYAPLIQNGLYYRLTDPSVREVGAWEFIAEDAAEVLVSAMMLNMHGNMTVNYVRLKGLEEGAMYRDTKSQKVYAAEALMESGILLPIELGEYQAYQMHFVKEQ